MTVAIGTPRSVWVCGSKNSSACTTLSAARAPQIGHGHVEEVLLLQQHAGAGVVDVEEALQVGERVGRAQRLDARVRQRDAIALGQREDQLGLERALDVDVQFGLGHRAQQRGPAGWRGADACIRFLDAHSIRSGTAGEAARLRRILYSPGRSAMLPMTRTRMEQPASAKSGRRGRGFRSCRGSSRAGGLRRGGLTRPGPAHKQPSARFQLFGKSQGEHGMGLRAIRVRQAHSTRPERYATRGRRQFPSRPHVCEAKPAYLPVGTFLPRP